MECADEVIKFWRSSRYDSIIYNGFNALEFHNDDFLFILKFDILVKHLWKNSKYKA